MEQDSTPSPESNLDYNDDGEQKRLGGYPPLKTVCLLSIGPLISQMIIALYQFIDSLVIARTIGQDGVAVLGAIYIVDFIPISFSDYLLTSISLRASYLFGLKQGEKVSQLYIDFIRVAFIFGILTPSLIIPITRPFVQWFGADSHLSFLCLQYILPSTIGSFFNYVYQISISLLEAEGRSILYGLIQFCSFILNICFLFGFLYGLKLPIWGASLAVILSEALPGIVVFYFCMKGKFSIHPTFSMFLKSFSDEICPALKIGISSLIIGISYSLPILLMQKYVNLASTSIGAYETVIEVWAIIEKLYPFCGAICVGFNYGFVPAASYAYGAKLKKRVKQLAFNMLWLATLFSTILGEIFAFFPDKMASLWSKDPTLLYWAKKMLPPVFYAAPFHAIQYMIPGLLQALQMVLDSTFVSLGVLVLTYPVFSTILYFTDKNNPSRILYTYTLSDCFSLITCLLALIRPMKKLSEVENDEYQSLLSQNENIFIEQSQENNEQYTK